MSKSRDIFFGQALLTSQEIEVQGEIVELNGEKFYKISNYDKMDPFFMTIVSNSDHWMFVSSKGGLTCGRRNPENALFPYYTDDKIHDASANTGSKSILLIEKEDKTYLWEPFAIDVPNVYETTRNIYKNTVGNKLVFEEVNYALNISFQYSWMNSDTYGFIKQSRCTNLSDNSTIQVSFVDGLQNILPYGVNRMLQSNMSTLVDGYKKCELDEESGLGIYTLSSILTDKAEPSEALKSTNLWSTGINKPTYLLSTDQLKAFQKGLAVTSEYELKGKRGAYFIQGEFELGKNESKAWIIVADINQGPSDVPARIKELKSGGNQWSLIQDDIDLGTEKLKELVDMADGSQVSADELSVSRHFSNTLFNVMRGGIFPQDYTVDKKDFKRFVETWNSPLAKKHERFFEELLTPCSFEDIWEKALKIKDADLYRLIYEYLPLTFSRRHGDPSRPWNQFSIDVKTEDGDQKLYYQGNWRDIFQNWEALALSYPGFIESFIAKFVNASTVDGYNPYRVTKDGIDWEILDPEDPWSNIGYWGDHQIVYLLKLMELSLKYHPEKLQDLFTENVFAYANVPYRVKAYDKLVANPQDSIEYDAELEELIEKRTSEIGSDGKLVINKNGAVLKVNLTEKIFVTVLSKLSNFVPGGGIWMNTQRPEWNDANNALVGNGLSMVTLYYLRKFISTVTNTIVNLTEKVELSEEVISFIRSLDQVLIKNKSILKSNVSDSDRKTVVDQLGRAGSEYRLNLYSNGFSESKENITIEELLSFLNLSLEYINHTIALNKREDKLFHSYNLLAFNDNGCSVEHLSEMLEGQVAVMSSGYLNYEGNLELLDGLRKSKMYRADQNSYTLYPNKELPTFLAKNNISEELVLQSEFLKKQLQTENKAIIEKDVNGLVHFNGQIKNANDLQAILENQEGLKQGELNAICDLYIESFNHRQFTGRSGTFYKYEGLGCIYWHMVSKLALAVQDVCLKAIDEEAKADVIESLKEHYYQIKDGIGLKKSPNSYGAFPIDPYSHTPGFTGVQQPGMTGQVKEDFIGRFGELGVEINKGCICFNPQLLSKEEFLEVDTDWKTGKHKIELKKGELGFTYCGTPVVYKLDVESSVSIEFETSEVVEIKGNALEQKESSFIFDRSGTVKSVRVNLALTY